MKKLTILCIGLLSVQAWADVAIVNIWSPFPGKNSIMVNEALQSKAVHEKLGAAVSIAFDQDLDMHYVAIFDDWTAYGKFASAAAASEEWQSLWQSFGTDPAAELARTFMINNPVVADAKPVSLVYSWDVAPGRTSDFLANAQEAMAIHERLGASVGINIDELGDVHYEMTFDSWEAWGAFMAKSASDKELADFFARVNQNPLGELVKVWRLNAMP